MKGIFYKMKQKEEYPGVRKREIGCQIMRNITLDERGKGKIKDEYKDPKNNKQK